MNPTSTLDLDDLTEPDYDAIYIDNDVLIWIKRVNLSIRRFWGKGAKISSPLAP